jgi:hypothetical protein
MGYDCRNQLPPSTHRKDVEDFLGLLGYVRLPRSVLTSKGTIDFFYQPDDDYKYLEGISASVYSSKRGHLEVDTHTRIWGSRYEIDFHNKTVKELKRRFGGSFESDNGRNRYLTSYGRYLDKAEAGCYQAYGRFYANVALTCHTIDTLRLSEKTIWPQKKSGIGWIDQFNPLTITANALVPLLVSVVEDYLRTTYIALLRYSPKKDAVIKEARLQRDDLSLIASREITVEEAVARSRSFQDLRKISDSFKELDTRIDIAGTLKRPYRRRSESIYAAIERIVKQRHQVIHRATIFGDYSPTKVLRDISTIHAGMERVYLELIKAYGWTKDHPDLGQKIPIQSETPKVA